MCLFSPATSQMIYCDRLPLSAGIAPSVQYLAVHQAACSVLFPQKAELPEVSSWAAGGSRTWQSWVSGIRSCGSGLGPGCLWQRPQGRGFPVMQWRKAEQEDESRVARRGAAGITGPSSWTSTEDVLSTDIGISAR